MNAPRVCSKCKLIKDSSEFAFQDKLKGTRHSYCLVCGRKFSQKHYAAHVRYYVEKSNSRRQPVMDELDGRLFNYLENHPCVDCGESDPVVLEFDHVRGQKKYNVSAMCAMLLSWDTFLKEIAKCEVRCANCHRRRTAERRGSYRHKRRNGSVAQFG